MAVARETAFTAEIRQREAPGTIDRLWRRLECILVWNGFGEFEVSTMRRSRKSPIVRLLPTSEPRPARLGDSCCASRKDRLTTANTSLQGSIKMNGHTFFSRIVGFFRAGYSADAPQLGHVALIAMCPAAARVVRPFAANRNKLV